MVHSYFWHPEVTYFNIILRKKTRNKLKTSQNISQYILGGFLGVFFLGHSVAYALPLSTKFKNDSQWTKQIFHFW